MVADAVSHALKPVPVNLYALLNVWYRLPTFATFHPDRSAFISLAPMKVPSREVAEEVSHLLMAVPTNVAALGLAMFDPPAWFRFLENAKLKSPTPLVSQSPMSPHVVVAVAVSWT